MDIDHFLIKQSKNEFEFTIFIDGKNYPLNEVTIQKTPNPVDRPTQRGGSYVSEIFSYKIKGALDDLNLIPLLSKTMLGPNQEFTELEIEAKNTSENDSAKLFAHLTSMVQTKSKIGLDMEIVRIL